MKGMICDMITNKGEGEEVRVRVREKKMNDSMESVSSISRLVESGTGEGKFKVWLVSQIHLACRLRIVKHR